MNHLNKKLLTVFFIEVFNMDNFKKIEEIAEKMHITFEKSNEKTIIFMDGIDVSEEIRTPQVDQYISPVAANPGVRKILVKKQQEMATTGGIVMDGRDIGTVVFPKAELKVFMIASVKERAIRRKKELEQKGILIDKDKVVQDIQYRDQQDASRNHGPLKKAPDAIEIDTSKMSIPEQVEKILELARGKLSALSR